MNKIILQSEENLTAKEIAEDFMGMYICTVNDSSIYLINLTQTELTFADEDNSIITLPVNYDFLCKIKSFESKKVINKKAIFMQTFELCKKAKEVIEEIEKIAIAKDFYNVVLIGSLLSASAHPKIFRGITSFKVKNTHCIDKFKSIYAGDRTEVSFINPK